MPGPGPRGPRGPKPQVENPGKLMGRLLKYVGKKLWNSSGNCGSVYFRQCHSQCPGNHVYEESDRSVYHATDRAEQSGFHPLLGAILKVAVFYLIGVLATFSYNRIMVYVTGNTEESEK